MFFPNGSTPPLPTFATLALHQCPSLLGMLHNNSWPWGRVVFNAATQEWLEAGLWNSIESTSIRELPQNTHDWVCFDTLFYEVSYGMFVPGPKHHRAWTEALLRALPGTRIASETPAQEFDNIRSRCGKGAIRIQVFQRQGGSSLRTFVNLDDVVQLLQNYTSLPVSVVTTDLSTPVEDQARLFRSVDLLVTPHGSHLVNLIFSEPQSTAVVEVVAAMYDRVFEIEAKAMNISSYLTSTGHMPVQSDGPSICNDGQKVMLENCAPSANSSTWHCTDTAIHKQLIHCNLYVNTTILDVEIRNSIDALCVHTLKTI